MTMSEPVYTCPGCGRQATVPKYARANECLLVELACVDCGRTVVRRDGQVFALVPLPLAPEFPKED